MMSLGFEGRFGGPEVGFCISSEGELAAGLAAEGEQGCVPPDCSESRLTSKSEHVGAAHEQPAERRTTEELRLAGATLIDGWFMGGSVPTSYLP